MNDFFSRAILVSSVLISIFAILSSCEKKEILVGFSGELSGINAELGTQARNGAILAIEALNSTGGVNGQKIRLIIRDDQGTPDKAVEVNTQLLAAGVVAVIGQMTSSQTMAVLPLMEREKTVLFSPSTSTPRLSGIKDHFFRLQGDLRFSAGSLGQFASNMAGFRNILVIKDASNIHYAAPFQAHFLKQFIGDKTQVLGELDFSSLDHINWNTKLKACDLEQYDGVLIIASPVSTAAIVQALRKADKGLIIVSSSWGATQCLIQHGGRSVEGVYLSKTGVVNVHHEHYRQFHQEYEQRFGRSPSFAANHGYHTARILAGALAHTRGEKTGLKEALSQFENYTYFYNGKGLDEYGDAYHKSSILKVEDSRFVTIMESHSIHGLSGGDSDTVP